MLIVAPIFLGAWAYSQVDDTVENTKLSYIRAIYWPMLKYSVTQGIAKADIQTARQPAKSVPVLVYHGIVPEDNGSDVTLENFREQMLALKHAGYNTISIYDFVEFIKNGKQLPDKSFLLTFDDGRKDSFYPVDPILQTLEFRAVMYVITAHMHEHEHYYLSFGELERIKKSGRWDLQAHAHEAHSQIIIDKAGNKANFLSHKKWLTPGDLSQAESREETNAEFRIRIRHELAKSKQELQKKLGVDVVSFAFPESDFGQLNKEFPEAPSIVLMETKALYRIAFAQAWKGDNKQNAGDLESFLMRRIEVRPEWGAAELMAALEASRVKDAFFEDSFENSNTGWESFWGKIEVQDGALNIQPAEQGVSAAAMLQGTSFWENYRAAANVQLVRGNTVSIIARRRDSNYVACTFGTDHRVQLEQEVGGQRKVLSIAEDAVPVEEKMDIYIGIYVDGNQAGCLFDNNIVIPVTRIDDRLNQGGIGFKVWSSEVETAQAQVKDVRVQEAQR